MNDRAAFLQARRGGIGGSDAAAVLGLAPPSWKRTPLSLYREKRGELADRAATTPMEWGELLEAPIVEAYRRRTGYAVVTGDSVQGLVSAEYPFMRCNLDGVAHDRNERHQGASARVVEAKLAGSDEDWGEPGTDQVPAYYIPQAQHNMAVSGLTVCDFPVLFARFGLRELQIYTVPRDDELIAMLIDAERELWRRIIEGDPPDPTTADDVRLRWPTDTGKTVEASETIVATCALLEQAKAEAKAAKHRVDDFELPVQTFMADASTLTYQGKTLATWKQARPSLKLDEELLRAGHPDIAAQYTKSRPGSRRFLLK